MGEGADKDISIYVQSLSIEDQEEIVAANQAQANLELAQGRNDLAPSPAFMMPPRPQEEPEKMKQWRIEQTKRLDEKDAKEAEMMATLKAEAQQELNEWYKRYDDKLAKTKEDNRQNELEFINGVNDIKPGTEWERVNKLCDFRHVSGKSLERSISVSGKSDTSRMKSILLQLKQQ